MTTSGGSTVDLNADLGEGFGVWRLGDDEALLGVVTSANVACGFHAGDATTIRRTVAAAAVRGVVVGAQVGYRDLAGFGRRRIDMDDADLTADWVAADFGALDRMRGLMAAATLIVIGAQLFFSGFMMSILSGNRARHAAAR